MKYTRTFVSFVALSLLVSPLTAERGAVESSGRPVGTDAPVLTHTVRETSHAPDPRLADYPATTKVAGAMVYAQTADQVDDFVWALGRFAQAGIELPFVEAWLHAKRSGCDGPERKGRGGFTTWREGRPVVFSCATRDTMLHELGHVLDRHVLTDDDRAAFMAARGVDRWQGVAWLRAGQEHYADVVAWGLSDQRWRHGRTEPNDPAALAAAFVLATNALPLPDPAPDLDSSLTGLPEARESTTPAEDAS